ncbi:MAG: alanine--tRNA ligase [Rickettsiales bacterium]|jgi:alanyl-tRNA synthetase|nr:alanine--tRNA ligase [Rickettsiales bacterium]
MATVDEIREKFLEFFRSKQFLIVGSSSLVPNDPTLLFTNSGMVQFKNYFSGVERPECPRIATAQKCVRAGGKHNDLDNVGYTARHHTFFEMLGNFSFGDYFKREAIAWAWEFLTGTLAIAEDRLLVTVYHSDREAYDIWHNEIGLAPEKIIKIATNDNFWEMGDIGPCGPCSEIFYDHGEEIAGGPPGSADEDGDRYVEIWNIVFTQFNKNEKGILEELSNRNIDTGIGLERLAAVLQGVHNNYDIDLFRKIIDRSRELFGDGDIFAHRIIADHLRSSGFLICDGVLPSNEGRGYVLRRIMRRAMLQLHRLGHRDLAMHKLVPCLVEVMGRAYPELKERRKFIEERMEEEEARFASTLENGMKLLGKRIDGTSGSVLSGSDAFELYDTYGFPLDLTEIILADRSMTVDVVGFNEAMEEQRKRARTSWVGSGDSAGDSIYLKIDGKTRFVGYDAVEGEARIVQLIKDGEFVGEIRENDRAEIIADCTCFFGESGGQVGDRGNILSIDPKGETISTMEVEDTIKSTNGLIIHRGLVESGKFMVGDKIGLHVDGARRARITANHSATHLLQFALRNLLGQNVVHQRGSHVDAESLRFDFSCNGYLDSDMVRSVEEIVNGVILENSETRVETMDLPRAKETGAIALFGEKYGDSVRVVFLGARDKPMATEAQHSYCSVELCGGSHVKRTGDIGMFKITKVESIATGVRRIEACTGMAALRYVNEKIGVVDRLGGLFKIGHEKLPEKIESLVEENRKLKLQLSSFEKSRLLATVFEEREVNGIRILFKDLRGNGASSRDIKQFVVSLRNTKYSKDTILSTLCSGESGKNIVMITLSENLVGNHSAVNILKRLGSNGGGVPNFATGSLERKIDIDSLVQAVSEKQS